MKSVSPISSPNEVTKHVQKLLDEINSEYDHELVPVVIDSLAKKDNCFINVEEKVKRDGGRVHYGWAVFQTDIVCEAIRHAVWETPEGDLIDITPRDTSFDTVMFVSKDDLIYTGQLIDNIRVNSTNNLVVDDFIEVCKALELFYTYGTRINDDEIILPEPSKTLVFDYLEYKTGYQTFLHAKNDHKSKCLCGSEKTYKNCHGKSMKLTIADDLKKVKRK